MLKLFLVVLLLVLVSPTLKIPTAQAATVPINNCLYQDCGYFASRPFNNYRNMSGNIVMRIQNHGEAYYLNPIDKKIYHLGVPKYFLANLRDHGVNVSNKDLAKIPMGILNPNGQTDNDHDGIADNIEKIIGTSPKSFNSDGDKYSDKYEIMHNYNPMGTGKLSVDTKFSAKQKGKILIQNQKGGLVWYVNPTDGKRYLISNDEDVFTLVTQVGRGISENLFEKLIN